ncbi:hypothetical protein HYT45_04475 [Candidatus Uhrbacteria bacterium]|nr:hypothetical protein [Candidatus Uhrbacteria bacterium]
MTKIKKLKTAALLSVLYFLFSSVPAFAATLFLEGAKTVGLNKPFEVMLILNAEGEFLNAYEGKITYPFGNLELKEIRDGNSFVNFWIERPKLPEKCDKTCEVAFAGITPGGYSGSSGLVFSLIFVPAKAGVAEVGIKGTRVLRNDGAGTPATLSSKGLILNIKEGFEAPEAGEIKDNELPEPFTITLSRDPNIFDDKYFIVFAAQDKQSGIDRYEVQERRRRQPDSELWQKAESPYLLADQELQSYIFVRAIDKAGNERLSSLAPIVVSFYKNYLFWIMAILAGAAAYAFWRLLRQKLGRKKTKKVQHR